MGLAIGAIAGAVAAQQRREAYEDYYGPGYYEPPPYYGPGYGYYRPHYYHRHYWH